MIIGYGDIASVLPDNSLLFFASGVSNSQETREEEYQREERLLLKQTQLFPHLVYFSSLAVFESDTRYIKHKRKMETLVKTFFPKHTIVRIGNITWGDNPHTLINYLKAHKDAPIQDVYRYVVDKEEFLYWINKIPDLSCEMNIPGRRMKVQEIVDIYCNKL